MGFKKATIKQVMTDHTVLIQTYEKTELPEGSVMIQQRNFTDDYGGSFKEIGRLSPRLESLKESGNCICPGSDEQIKTDSANKTVLACASVSK